MEVPATAESFALFLPSFTGRLNYPFYSYVKESYIVCAFQTFTDLTVIEVTI